MTEVWLRTNARALRTIALVPALLSLAGFFAAWVCWRRDAGLLAVALVALGACSLLVAILMWVASHGARIARQGGDLLLFVSFGPPARVPLSAVEAFLLGQAPIPAGAGAERPHTKTVVIKLSDRADEWRKAPTSRNFADWCNSYVTIKGAWTEPLSVELVQQLNERLAAAQRDNATAGVR